ncbi:MAG TPA: hypothetical protein EYN06_07770 [Myxococcales bacterium]|nr:hypothetical protein [Myxococcales bacterium]
MTSTSKQKNRFHEPLVEQDSETQTVGCRYTNPDICRNNGLVGKCAFCRPDNICLLPPRSWPKQYKKLLAEQDL